MEKQSLSQKLSHSTKDRNDDHLALKWAGPRVLHTETTPYKDPGISFLGDPGKTDPSQADDCDINNIVARYHKTGVFPGTDVPAVFGDLSDTPTYQDALQVIINAENAFMTLDAKTRKKFSNSPSEFLEFIDDPQNAAEMVKMGLATIVEPSPSPAVSEPRGGQPRPPKKDPKPALSSKDDES